MSPIVWTDNEEANRLLDTDPLALLIGMVLDQQVKMEKAFIGPYELKKRLAGSTCGRSRAWTPTGWTKFSANVPRCTAFQATWLAACRR